MKKMIKKRSTSISSVRPAAKRSSLIRKSNTESLSVRKPPRIKIGFSGSNTVRLSPKQKQQHTHIIGSTGTGKSKLLELLIRQDILNKNAGFCLIDPHGSLYDDILRYSAQRYPHLAERFVLFNPAGEMEKIVGFNPIPQGIDPAQLVYILESLLLACLKAWGQDNTEKTPRIRRWLLNIFYPILVNNLTLVESAYMLPIDDHNARRTLLQNISNEMVLNDWRMFENSSIQQRQEYIEGASNRIYRFLMNGVIRDCLGQTENILNFSRIMDEGKIVLINLNGGIHIPQEDTRLLGVMIVNEIYRTSKLRNALDPKTKPFYLYIDEFAQFVTKDIAKTLDECRKYKLFLTLAHQHLSQLKQDDEYLYASVMTNCKNKVVFGGLSNDDADIMSNEIANNFVNLKEVKDEVYQTKFKPVETTRTSKQRSGSETLGDTWSKSDQQTTGTANQKTDSTSTGTNRSTNTGQNSSINENKSHYRRGSESSGRGKNESINTGQNSSNGHSNSYSRTESNAHSDTTGGQKSKTSGWSETVAPFTEHKKFSELSSRTFWSLEEVQHMKKSALRTQDTGSAFFKFGNAMPPVQVKIANVEAAHYSLKYTPENLKRFRERSYLKNPDYYIEQQEARFLCEQRQADFFQTPPLRLDEAPLVSETRHKKKSIEAEYEIIEPINKKTENPFE